MVHNEEIECVAQDLLNLTFDKVSPLVMQLLFGIGVMAILMFIKDSDLHWQLLVSQHSLEQIESFEFLTSASEYIQSIDHFLFAGDMQFTDLVMEVFVKVVGVFTNRNGSDHWNIGSSVPKVDPQLFEFSILLVILHFPLNYHFLHEQFILFGDLDY